jgi:hypothetical protein
VLWGAGVVHFAPSRLYVHVDVMQAMFAHLLNLWDKTLLFRSCATQSGCSIPRQLLLLLGIRASCRLSLPVLKENLSRVVRGAGGSGAGLGTTLHLSSSEDVPDDDSEAVSVIVLCLAARHCAQFAVSGSAAKACICGTQLAVRGLCWA